MQVPESLAIPHFFELFLGILCTSNAFRYTFSPLLNLHTLTRILYQTRPGIARSDFGKISWKNLLEKSPGKISSSRNAPSKQESGGAVMPAASACRKPWMILKTPAVQGGVRGDKAHLE